MCYHETIIGREGFLTNSLLFIIIFIPSPDEHLLRTSLEDDGEGFFIALFVRKADHKSNKLPGNEQGASPRTTKINKSLSKKKLPVIYFFSNKFRMFLCSAALSKQMSHKSKDTKKF